MRRYILGLLTGLLAFGVGARIVGRKADGGVVHSSSSAGFTVPGRELMIERREIYPSPSEAAEEFDTQLQNAAEYTEFGPCFDAAGRRTGERAVLLLRPPHVPSPTWRIAWTYRSDNFSEFYSVESPSLSDARYLQELQSTERADGRGPERCSGKGAPR